MRESSWNRKRKLGRWRMAWKKSWKRRKRRKNPNPRAEPGNSQLFPPLLGYSRFFSQLFFQLFPNSRCPLSLFSHRATPRNGGNFVRLNLKRKTYSRGFLRGKFLRKQVKPSRIGFLGIAGLSPAGISPCGIFFSLRFGSRNGGKSLSGSEVEPTFASGAAGRGTGRRNAEVRPGIWEFFWG